MEEKRELFSVEKDLVMDSLVHKLRNVSPSAQDLCEVRVRESEGGGEEESGKYAKQSFWCLLAH